MKIENFGTTHLHTCEQEEYVSEVAPHTSDSCTERESVTSEVTCEIHFCCHNVEQPHSMLNHHRCGVGGVLRAKPSQVLLKKVVRAEDMLPGKPLSQQCAIPSAFSCALKQTDSASVFGSRGVSMVFTRFYATCFHLMHMPRLWYVVRART